MHYRDLFADRYSAASLIRRLIVEEGSKNWHSYAINFVLAGIVAACTALSAYLIGHMVNEAYVAKSFIAVVGLSVLAITVFVVKGFSTYAQVVLLAKRGNAITARLQQQLIAKLLTENLAYFANKPSATVMTHVNLAASAPPSVLNSLINTALRDTLSLIGLTVVMIIQDPVLSIGGLVVLPMAILSIRNLIHRLRISTLDQIDGTAKVMGAMQECLQGLPTVKAFGLERQIEKRVEFNAQATRKAADKIARLSNRSGPFMESLAGFAIAGIFMYGGYSVIVAGASPGQFVSFITAFLLAYQPGKRLARLHIDLSLSLAGVRMLYADAGLAPDRTGRIEEA